MLDLHGISIVPAESHLAEIARDVLDFQYDAGMDAYRCPQGQLLTYRTTNREGYREYRSDPKTCRNCPLLTSCTQNDQKIKTVTRHVWEESRERLDAHRLTAEGRQIYKRRKVTIEHSFADGKELHGQLYVRMRGLLRAMEQCLLSAACQNMKKMALILTRKQEEDEKGCLRALLRGFVATLRVSGRFAGAAGV